MPLDNGTRHAANLAVLRRQDSSITDIVDSTSFSVVYKLAGEPKAWTKLGVEGTLFLVQRSRSPYYGIIILNRQSMDNFVTLLTDSLEFQLTSEYIMYQTPEGVYGLWLYETKDRERLAQRLMTLSAQSKAGPANNHPTPQGGQSFDIMSLLQTATGAKKESSPAAYPAPPVKQPVPDPTASLLQLLQKSKKTGPERTVTPPPMPKSSSHSLLAQLNGKGKTQTSPSEKAAKDGKALLALLQNPTHVNSPSLSHSNISQYADGRGFQQMPSPQVAFHKANSHHSPQYVSPSHSQQPNIPRVNTTNHTFNQRMEMPTPTSYMPSPTPPSLNDKTMNEPPRPFSFSGADPLKRSTALDISSQAHIHRLNTPPGSVLSKPEFIQQFMNMVQNDATFFDDLYNSYVQSVRR